MKKDDVISFLKDEIENKQGLIDAINAIKSDKFTSSRNIAKANLELSLKSCKLELKALENSLENVNSSPDTNHYIII